MSAILATAGFTLTLLLSCRTATAEVDSSSPGTDRGVLVVLAPNGPVLTELQITVARRPYRQWLADFLADQLDVNNSGGLTESELGLLTGRFKKIIGIKSARKILREASGSATATSVPVTGFAAWMQTRIPRAFDISAESSQPDNSVRLGSLIDVDGNSLVSGEELKRALQTMRFRDLDDDQTFSVSELLPYRDPRTQNASLTPDVASLPFVHLTDEESVERAVDRIMKQYGSDDVCDVSVFRLSPSQLAETSLTADSQFDRQTLAELLASPPFHMLLDIQLSDLANRSQTDVTVAPAARQFCKVSHDGFNDVSLNIDGVPLTVKARGGAMNDRAYLRGFLGQNFVMYDEDSSQSLNKQEFNAFSQILQQSGIQGRFKAVDVNGDKEIDRNEMHAFAERDLFARRSRIEVSINQDGKTLFSIMDVNGDRRLTVRELQDGVEPLSQYDLNGDSEFGESELGTEYVLTIGLGRSDVRRMSSTAMAAMQMQGGNRTDAILPGTEGLKGPEWFRRMDRNQDGDVSRREFLGPFPLFDQLDTDGDNLLDADEADAATPVSESDPEESESD